MKQPFRRPEDILALRPLRRILEAKGRALWTAQPGDSVMTALKLMAGNNIGFLVVLDGGWISGVLSERDCVRKVVLAGKSADETTVADVMERSVISIDIGHTFADCLRVMKDHDIRHLPVTDRGSAVTVLSIRDLLNEAISHQARVIAELERERLTIFTSPV